MKNIFEITYQRRELMAQIEACEGELTEELQEQLAINRSDFEEKAEVYIALITQYEADQALAQSEIDRLSMFKERKSKAAQRLKETLLTALKPFGAKDPDKDHWKATAGTYTLSTRKSPPSVFVADENAIPMEWKRIPAPPAPQPDKKAIMEALNKGIEVPGCELKEGGISLTIK